MENILVLDSGIGGLYTVKVLKEKYPNYNYVYFKDTFNCPYGNKSKEELFKVAQNNINFMLKRYKIKAVVLACNTLSTNCFKTLKIAYNLPFFKVEPPLNKITDNAIVLCTKTCYNALKSGFWGKENAYSEITTFETRINNQKRTFCAMHNLAYIIEHNLNNKPFLKNYLISNLQPLFKENYKQLIIGCTHYNFVKNELETLFSNCEFLEGSDYIKLGNI